MSSGTGDTLSHPPGPLQHIPLHALMRVGVQRWSLPKEHIRSHCPGRSSSSAFVQQNPMCQRTCCFLSLSLLVAEVLRDVLGL